MGMLQNRFPKEDRNSIPPDRQTGYVLRVELLASRAARHASLS